MKIALFLEGSPGHEKQSLALVEALKRLHEIEVEQISLPKQSVLQRVLDAVKLFLPFQPNCHHAVADADLLVGTGSRTHIPMLFCKKKYGMPVVTCMTPDWYVRKRFDLCLVPRHDGIPEGANIFMTDGPPVLNSPDLMTREVEQGLILIGGKDEASHFWNSAEIVHAVKKIVSADSGRTWTVSSSPRTPEDTVELLRNLDGDFEQVVFHHYLDTPRGWVEEQYAKAAVAWVTADSVSMVYEALTAGCRVGIIPVCWKKKHNKFQKSIDFLQEKGLVRELSGASDSGPLSAEPIDFDEAARCADEIARRFLS